MAIEYLAEGATTLNASAWSGSGFADNATLIIDKSFGNGSPLTTDTDQSGLTEGIDYLDIQPGAEGQLGTGSSPLRVDADTGSGDRIINHGHVTLYLKAEGDDNLINNFDCAAPSRNYLVGGTFTNTTVQGGEFSADANTVLTNIEGYNGNGVVEYNSTAITSGKFYSGTWVIKRPGVYIVGGTARVTFDMDDGASMTGSSLTQHGGHVVNINGGFLTADLRAGLYDESKARRPFEVGATAMTIGGARTIKSGMTTWSNVSYPGAMQRSQEAPAGVAFP